CATGGFYDDDDGYNTGGGLDSW
nr:immunoglobulin heavy chain junction region [Macaca mulatta]MOX94463.1 immunoglobulin heavy chain junction region [Macaca mulatta]